MKSTTLSVLLGTIFLVGGCGEGLVSPPLTHNTTGSTLPTSTTGGHASSSTSSTSGGVSGSTGTTGLNGTTGDSTIGTGTTSGSTGGSQDSTSTSSSTGGLTCSNCSSDQVCDSRTGRCVHCASDSDCSGATPICQTSTDYLRYGECVQCSEGEPTCPGTLVCDLSLGRTYHHCVSDCRLVTTAPACSNDNGSPAHCAQATGTCVGGCAAAADCAPSPLVCDVDAGSCVECLSAADCPYSNPGCNLHTCGSCADDTSCPAGLACSLNNYLGASYCSCLDGGGCGGNAPICNETSAWYSQYSWVCGCLTDQDCAAQGAICNPGAGALGGGTCIPPCNDGGVDCSKTNQYCDLDSGFCGLCGFDDQCIGNHTGPHCLSNGVCGCNANGDCGSGNVCDSTQCLASCAIDGGTDCTTTGDRQFCDLGTGLCTPCSANSQCIGNDAGPVCLTNGACGCQSASDCGLNGACDNNGNCQLSCTLDGGTECSYSNQVCDPDSRVCVDCLDDTQCSAPTPACTADTHQGNSCVECVLPSQCPDSNPGCNALYQRCGWCYSDVDCPTSLPLCNPSSDQCVSSCLLSDGGTFCAAGACDTSSGFCVNCLQDSDCQDPTYPYCATDIDAGDYCLQCYLPSQCPDSNPGCSSIYDRCGQCESNADCPASAPLCNPMDAQCVSSCVLSDGGTSCETGGCDITSGFCVACVQDSNCQLPDYPYCATDVDAGERCVQCVTPDQCPDSTPGCNAQYNTCGFCFADTDCPSSAPLCLNELCVMPCDGGGQCTTGACNVDAGFCVQCVQDSDCVQPDLPYCVADLGDGNYCVQCLASSDCGDAGLCNGAYFQCGSCFYNTDCPAGLPMCRYDSSTGVTYCSDGGF